MPSLNLARRMASTGSVKGKTIGDIHKQNSDWAMEMTWDNDIQSKLCYIYDYYHDNQPLLKDHMTYDDTTKTAIAAKFIVKSSQSISSDRVAYYIQFKPSQKTEFESTDELYYFETDYRSIYHNDDFVGLYIDIPDERGVYRKWLICMREEGNQFIKYLILPVNYEFMWIERDGRLKIKRRMWSCLRNQNSYNSGLWTADTFTTQENQNKIMLPLNAITSKLWYTNDSSSNMRVLVSALTENPIAWTISKVENINMPGIVTVTLYQDSYNQYTDYINFETGEMYADYYDTGVEPIEDTESADDVVVVITASTDTIKVGGSYKTLTAELYDADGNSVTEDYSDEEFVWTCAVDEIDLTDYVTWYDMDDYNSIKVKFPNDKEYLEQILVVTCTIGDYSSTIQLEITA